ncbi:Mur ligase family protein [Coriobacteriia bacterium Es71-Z0120]|uniref:bifunctional folylpolyglutamate synthase/dihydrofolate synthase n=1 Tax=Parvivirga hydrogeniphila TaxID=2939460 RepID=UPI002260F37D|nr:Mur ligase family protein [Parvivirga hydrogeniphila]MCL4079262.1 Mur ligase family protein [Parvivirga hydrogeniphila]
MSRSYEEVVGELERALKFGINPSLDGIQALADALGRPERAYRAVQVTGTNGKTSVTRMTAALLAAHGARSGAYTSPHLVRYEERVEVDGEPVAPSVFAEGVSVALDAADRVAAGAAEALGLDAGGALAQFTEFEILTAGALRIFARTGVDWAVLEVGMGGRWDATSVVSPQVAVITGVALDHTDRLGATREEIAADKAHVIKPGSIAVLGPGCAGVEHVLFERALSCGAPTVRVGQGEDDVAWSVRSRPRALGEPLVLDVFGAEGTYRAIELVAPTYQAPNVATAVAAAEAALGPLDERAVRAAFAGLRLPGRFQVLDPSVPLVVDGAHNPEAAGVLADAVRELMPGAPVVVLGVMADKDARGIVDALVPVARGFVCTRSVSPRALDPAELSRLVSEAGGAVYAVESSVATAVEAARLLSSSGVLCTGSLYVAGEVVASYPASSQR